ncbi:MAG: alpha/beta hydrolase family protein [Myxococcota bacterium]
MRWWIGVLGLVACGGADPETLFAPGEFDVGYMTTTLTYEGPGLEEPRTLTVNVWYPAQEPGAQVAQYKVAGIITQDSALATFEPPPFEGEARLVVYSHGSGGEGLLGYPLGENMASHGWVVVAPDHAGNTARDFLANTWAPSMRTTVNRPLDIHATLDAAGAGLVEGLDLRVDGALLVGHSFGGYTALTVGGAKLDVDAYVSACEDPPEEEDGSCEVLANAEVQAALRGGFRDERIGALVPQAPALIPNFAAGELAGIDIPVMVQSGQRDQSTTHEMQAVPAWEGLNGADDVWVNLPDGGHYSFVTICDDLNPTTLQLFRPDAMDDGCNETFTPVSRTIPTLAAYANAFAQAHLLGDKSWGKAISGEPWREGFEVTVRGE